MTDDYTRERDHMVTWQIEKRGVTNQAVLRAMRAVQRHLFISPEMREHAYADYPLPIGNGQTISQPYIVALMTSLLNLDGTETMLEVGTGSGYQAAVLSLIAREVHTVEFIPALALEAAAALNNMGYANVIVHQGDGSLGWEEAAPYDAIMVTASAPKVPPPLLAQLKPTGRLVLPVGSRGMQRLELWRQENSVWQPEEILPVAFVPLRGEHGWARDED